MKVIKRDGSTVDFDRSKIVVAIQKANLAVEEPYRMDDASIEAIADSVASKDRKRLLVEDIQDMVEKRLMEAEKYELAKAYIIYRYTRALVRKANTTDESILALIRNDNKDLAEENSNKNTAIASTQRDYIAGEVSRDLTRRLLLPEKISKAHDDGVLHFHDADYFVQHIFNCCLVNIGDMLDNGDQRQAHRVPQELPGGLHHRHPDHRLRGLQPVRRPVGGDEPPGQVPAPDL